MYFHASAIFAKDAGLTELASQPTGSLEAGQHWFVHRVILGRRKCVLAMEEQTRFVLLFCGLTKPDFAQFPALFADRLWRTIAAVCEVPDARFDHVRDTVSPLCMTPVWHKFQNRSVQSHIRQAAFELEWLIHRDGFPASITQEFAYSLKLNETPRTKYREKQCLWPLGEFQKVWREQRGIKEGSMKENICICQV